MKIHREGYPLILIFFCILAGLVVLVDLIFTRQTWFHYLFYGACVIALVFLAAFFRSPYRQVVDKGNIIVAPADGKVVVIERIFDHEIFRDERVQVSIFMSPFNVHVNWYPVSGKISYCDYMPGRYLVAWHPKSSQDNERTTVIVENKSGHKVLVRQIAGAIARRIVCYAKENQEVVKGQEMGFIKFGSRIDLLLPKDTQIMVSLQQKVTGKQTVIGRLIQ